MGKYFCHKTASVRQELKMSGAEKAVYRKITSKITCFSNYSPTYRIRRYQKSKNSAEVLELPKSCQNLFSYPLPQPLPNGKGDREIKLVNEFCGVFSRNINFGMQKRAFAFRPAIIRSGQKSAKS
jgi:hypothetical protein